jgi:O-antigen/teichoic acid export membrane protein
VLAVAVLAGSAAETGYAALAVGIALGVTYAILQSFTVSLPRLTHDATSDGEDGFAAAEATLRRLAGGLLAGIAPAAAIVALALPTLVPAVFGEDYRDAAAAFAPALAMVVLAPLNALAVQVSALRLRPLASLASGLAAAVAFVVVALVAVPAWGAAGGTAAALAAAAASAGASILLLPGAVGARLALGSLGGAVVVLALAALA